MDQLLSSVALRLQPIMQEVEVRERWLNHDLLRIRLPMLLFRCC